jgi:hypothetical protein
MLMAMESRHSPNISSFVIRFVIESAATSEQSHQTYRGSIRHIQSDEELHFNTWEDAVEFIKCYVPLEASPGQGNT